MILAITVKRFECSMMAALTKPSSVTQQKRKKSGNKVIFTSD